VLRAAVGLADEGGIAALTMRRLAQELGVEAMSLYHHVADKGEVLNGMVEVIVGEINARAGQIDLPDGTDWKAIVRRRILAARDVLLDHPWAPALLESQSTNMSPTVLRYYDSLMAAMLGGGLSADLVHHAMHALGSRALGFSQELFDENNDDAGDSEVDAIMQQQMANEYPHITQIVMAAQHDGQDTLGWCDDQFEFEFGLDLILDGLEGLRDRS
jgi:AcrR family transcriptional regulator